MIVIEENRGSLNSSVNTIIIEEVTCMNRVNCYLYSCMQGSSTRILRSNLAISNYRKNRRTKQNGKFLVQGECDDLLSVTKSTISRNWKKWQSKTKHKAENSFLNSICSDSQNEHNCTVDIWTWLQNKLIYSSNIINCIHIYFRLGFAFEHNS